MFCKNALIVNGILALLSIFMWLWADKIKLFNFELSYYQFKCSGVLLLIVYFLIFYALSLLFLFCMIAINSVKIGKPPLGSIVIAYKFGYSNTLTSAEVNKVDDLFPTNDKVQICYERRLKSFGIAHGAILHQNLEEMNEETKAYAVSHGYRIFHFSRTPNAMYISCPNLPWLPYIGVWLILCIAYPKLYKYSKRRKLSAYPVVEVYRRFSVLLMAPLSHQDNFVVPEAEDVLQRSSSSLNRSVISSVNVSPSIPRHSKSRSTTFYSVSTKDDFVCVTKPTIVKLANGITKQG